MSHNKGTTSQTDDAGRVSAYDFDNGTLTEKWRKITSDYSAATGITLFDFNQDGAGELVYRSITHLHVLNGVNGTDMMSPEVCSSPTGMEYPIVVDYNNDGSAEIIVTGGSATLTLDPLLAGKLRAYGSDGAAWAPARKVWNQYMYNAVNINEDLTVPRRMLNPATVFPGEDGLIGTIDDVRPYNSFLQQQTLLSVTGETLWKLPDYVVTGTPIAEYFTSGDSIIISNICVENNGDARGGDNIQIALYRDNRSPANLLKVYTLPAAIEVGSAPRCYKIKYVGASAITASSLYIEVNDDGAVHPQTECDYSGNSILMPFASMLIARNDYMTIFACGTNTIDILANDLNAFGATASIVSGGKYGSTSTVVLSYFTYDHALSDCADHAGKRDTAVYKISNGTVSSSAYIFIDILHAPDIVLVDSCSLHPYLAVTHEYLGATYRWYRSTNGVNGWSEIPGQTESRLYVTDNDYYRVEVTFKGAVGESSALRFIVVKKRKLSGNIIWYESKSEKQ